MQKADALTRKTGNAKEGTEAQFFADGTLAAEWLGTWLGTEKLDTSIKEQLDTSIAEIRLIQIMALEQSWKNELFTERQNELSTEHENELSIERQNELSAERQNELPAACQNELPGFDVTTWQRNHEGLLIPPNEAYKLEVLRACHDSDIAGNWGRHRTQELVSRNFW